MAVKMRKWSPWPAATRRFQVAVKPIKLEGLQEEDGGDEDESQMRTTENFVAIKIKWKGEPKFFTFTAPFQRNSRQKIEFSREKVLKKGLRVIVWDEEDQWFENSCCFSVVSNSNHHHHHHQKLGAWEISFNVLYGDQKMDAKAKMAVIGRVSINIAEIALNMNNSSVEQKLPLKLQIDGIAREATLTVLLNFVEIREPQDSIATTRGGSTKCSEVKGLSDNEFNESVKGRRKALSQEEITLDESDESSTFEAKDESAAPTSLSLSTKKEGWFSWKSRRFSIKRAKTKEDNFEDEQTQESCSNQNPDPQCSDQVSQKDDPGKPGSGDEGCRAGVWEEKEIISRDGQTKLKSQVFFASFDQRSDKAAGESACTALVAVISHWLHSNSDAMPNRPEFDNLIIQGSSEWRKLCENAAYVNDFPNKHFDLETVLRANIRPISISHNKSFVGFFGAETFESLKEAMSFDDIWNEISSNNEIEPRIYIVSWNDHFFVLKAEGNAYYIIDTLGERLFEGCNQAYILKFDDSVIMQKHAGKEKSEASKNNSTEDEEKEKIICSGKECCREFIKRFLAAIPLKELEEEEKKKTVSYFSLHHRLQIEFNYSCSFSLPSSSTSSPFSSSPDTCISSPSP
ncbi:hypothetical protein BUALT_Bualt10G0137400 [Buddleja alternifolia]|uniref:C2 NT-type domain-containing protein n=1 Tax=Buddleja alternifolia TaxID=168488 RepID=A0AAV6WZQ0_9LAMI|nr:hypothetical protein BUALT_Bualt10G0137400 [Buddleja alternifolia]